MLRAIMAPATVLVTGATGFLGEHVVRQLSDKGYRVRALARSTSPALAGLAGVEQLRGDVTGAAAELVGALRGAAGVFHLAGVVSRDPDDGQRMMRVHVD